MCDIYYTVYEMKWVTWYVYNDIYVLWVVFVPFFGVCEMFWARCFGTVLHWVCVVNFLAFLVFCGLFYIMLCFVSYFEWFLSMFRVEFWMILWSFKWFRGSFTLRCECFCVLWLVNVSHVTQLKQVIVCYDFWGKCAIVWWVLCIININNNIILLSIIIIVCSLQ